MEDNSIFLQKYVIMYKFSKFINLYTTCQIVQLNLLRNSKVMDKLVCRISIWDGYKFLMVLEFSTLRVISRNTLTILTQNGCFLTLYYQYSQSYKYCVIFWLGKSKSIDWLTFWLTNWMTNWLINKVNGSEYHF